MAYGQCEAEGVYVWVATRTQDAYATFSLREQSFDGVSGRKLMVLIT